MSGFLSSGMASVSTGAEVMIFEPINLNSIGFASQQLQVPVDLIRAMAERLGVRASHINGVAYINADDVERIRAALAGQSQPMLPVIDQRGGVQ